MFPYEEEGGWIIGSGVGEGKKIADCLGENKQHWQEKEKDVEGKEREKEKVTS